VVKVKPVIEQKASAADFAAYQKRRKQQQDLIRAEQKALADARAEIKAYVDSRVKAELAKVVAQKKAEAEAKAKAEALRLKARQERRAHAQRVKAVYQSTFEAALAAVDLDRLVREAVQAVLVAA
jgi:uncharacterized NAD(P)/FAD-binding protein YdhS